MIQHFRAIYLLSISIFLFCCAVSWNCRAEMSSVPQVSVSIKPLYNLCAGIMGSIGKPKLLLTGNSSPHDYHLKPSDISTINNSDLIIWAGPELETFLKKPLETLQDNQKILTLIQSKNMKLLPMRNSASWSHDCCNHHDHHHHHHATDPHFWLSPDNAFVIIENINDKLVEIDPQHANIYKNNSKKMQEELIIQIAQLKKQLESVQKKPYIVFHDAYQYFEQYFQLNGIGSITLHPEIPPSAQRIQEIQKRLINEQVVCIFSEPQFNDKVIKILLQDTKINQRCLDPLGNDTDLGPQGYIAMLNKLSIEFIEGLKNSVELANLKKP